MGRTLFDKVWESHLVPRARGEPALLYIDLHLVHEVTSPQAFEGLRTAGRKVRRPDLTVATMDHNVVTGDDHADRRRSRRSSSRHSRRNCEEFGVPLYATGSGREGIVHVIGPELGLTQPGMTIVCGDTHTSTHGAFGALAFGIGTSEVEHVLATQTLQQHKPKTMRDPRRRRAAGRRRPRRTSSSRSSARSATDGGDRLRRSSTPARRSARSRWKAA